ncbi:hypothetical protein C8Q75DRAFT_20429 [Abortiporus biennis]|nr:hypothetical protein C8Q75DRAFT_20429 [Abortiporus biennis]
MVHLSLVPLKGSLAGKCFPHQGFLGLTPVRVEGVLLAQRDRGSVQAKSLTISVRCYEQREGKTGVINSRLLVDYSQVIWRPSEGEQSAEFGDFQSSFKINLPKRVPGFSSANFQEYRTFWRLEAALEHVHISGVGSRTLRYSELQMIRFDVPPPLTPPSPTDSITPFVLYTQSSRPAPILHYGISTPTQPIGPSDFIFTSVYLRPLDPTASIRSISVLVERRLSLLNAPVYSSGIPVSGSDYVQEGNPPPLPPKDIRPSTSSSANHIPLPITVSSSMPEQSHRHSPYNFQSYSSTTLDTLTPPSSIYSATEPLLPPSTPPSASTPQSENAPPKVLTAAITYADSGRGGFSRDESSGIWSRSVSMQWPKTRSKNVWSMGETIRSELAEVTFWVKVKVIISSPTYGTETYDLEPREILVVSTNESDRKLALTQFAAQKEIALARDRSKSKSPGRNKTLPTETNDEEIVWVDKTPATKGLVSSEFSSNPWDNPPRNLARSMRPSTSHQQRSQPLPSPSASASPTSYRIPPPPPQTANPLTTSFRDSIASSSKPTTRSSKSRRPHTSAGPRDTSNLPYNDSSRHHRHHTKDSTVTSRSAPHRPGTSGGDGTKGFGISYSVDIEGNSRGRPAGISHEIGDDRIRAWEEELRRIEKASKRSTVDMLGGIFGLGRRKRERDGDKNASVRVG